MNAKTQADIMLEIVYAAYATHIKVAQSKSIKALGMDADEYARKHWDQHLPGIQTLWTGLVKAVIGNVVMAQSAGQLPPMIKGDFIAPMLPGLGAPLADPNAIPAGLARRLAARFRGEGSASRTGPAPAAGDTPAPALDVSPGLAIGRCTEDSAPADCGSSDSGSDGGGGGD
jgi:hypothetical protein